MSHQAVHATAYDQYQEEGNRAAHDPVQEAAANAVSALPQIIRAMYVDLFDVVFGDGGFASISQGWSVADKVANGPPPWKSSIFTILGRTHSERIYCDF